MPSSRSDDDQARRSASSTSAIVTLPSSSMAFSDRLWPSTVSGASGRDPAGPCLRRGQVADALDQPQPVGIGPGDDLGGEQHAPGRAVPGEQCQPVRRPVVDHHAEPGGGHAEGGVWCGDPQVTGDGELQAGAERRALDGGDRDQVGIAQQVQQVPQRVAERLVPHDQEIGARAEVAAGARQEQHPGPAVDGAGDRGGQAPRPWAG